jgi:hypothetical protein
MRRIIQVSGFFGAEGTTMKTLHLSLLMLALFFNAAIAQIAVARGEETTYQGKSLKK